MLKENKLWRVTIYVEDLDNSKRKAFETFYVVANTFDEALAKTKEYAIGRQYETVQIILEHEIRKLYI